MQEGLTEPVIAADGHTYEKTAIQHWLQQQDTWPVTGEVLSTTAVLPNRVIRDIIAARSIRVYD